MNKRLLTIRQRRIPYTIIFSARKSLVIRMSGEGELEVKAPKQMQEEEIEQFLQEKQDWILKQAQRAEQQKKQKMLFEWKDGYEIPINGTPCLLSVSRDIKSKRNKVQFENAGICLVTNDDSVENVRAVLVLWFKKIGRRFLEDRTHDFARQMQVEYNRITLKELKSCWGSCSSKGNLNYNWKLLLMPEQIIDYIVVHELSHLREMNHSPKFWQSVEEVLPDYKERKKWLKENGFLYEKL